MPSLSSLCPVVVLLLAYFSTSCISLHHNQFHSSRSTGNPVNLRILPLGDSITFGEGSTDGNGYRLILSQLLAMHGNNLSYIGSVQSGTMANNDHEGHGGFQIFAVGLTGKPDYPLRPNVVLLMAGTNDIVFNNDVDEAPNRLGAVMQDIIDACPEVVILVATLTPLLNPGWASKIIDFNSVIPTVVTDFANNGSKVALVDMAGVTAAHINPTDGIHPTDDGYERIASAWYNGVISAIDKGWIGQPLPGLPQNQSSEQSGSEKKIIESQPKTPTLGNERTYLAWTNAHIAAYAVILLILLLSARRMAGILSRRYRG